MPNSTCLVDRLHLDHGLNACETGTRVFIDSKAAIQSVDERDVYELPESLHRIVSVNVSELKIECGWCMLTESERTFTVRKFSDNKVLTHVVPSSVCTVMGGKGRKKTTEEFVNNFNQHVTSSSEEHLKIFTLQSTLDGEKITWTSTGGYEILDCGFARSTGLTSFPVFSSGTTLSSVTGSVRHGMTLPDIYLSVQFVNSGMSSRHYSMSAAANKKGDQCCHKVSVDCENQRNYIFRQQGNGSNEIAFRNPLKRTSKIQIRWFLWNGETVDLQGSRYSLTLDVKQRSKTK